MYTEHSSGEESGLQALPEEVPLRAVAPLPRTAQGHWAPTLTRRSVGPKAEAICPGLTNLNKALTLSRAWEPGAPGLQGVLSLLCDQGQASGPL